MFRRIPHAWDEMSDTEAINQIGTPEGCDGRFHFTPALREHTVPVREGRMRADSQQGWGGLYHHSPRAWYSTEQDLVKEQIHEEDYAWSSQLFLPEDFSLTTLATAAFHPSVTLPNCFLWVIIDPLREPNFILFIWIAVLVTGFLSELKVLWEII